MTTHHISCYALFFTSQQSQAFLDLRVDCIPANLLFKARFSKYSAAKLSTQDRKCCNIVNHTIRTAPTTFIKKIFTMGKI